MGVAAEIGRPMPAPSTPIRLYRHPLSGHAHRAELFLSLLGLPVELVDVDLAAGGHKRPEFLTLNPFGQLPVIEDGDVVLADSNAILVYLALRYDPSGAWLPREPAAAARVQRWLSVAAGQLANGPNAARLVALFGAPLDVERARAVAGELYRVIDPILGETPYLVGQTPTIADVAIYSYTVLAPEGGVDLAPFAHVATWLARIEELPGFTPMRRTPTAESA